MPLPKRWKVVGGSVSAAMLLSGGIANAQLGDTPGRIALDDQVTVGELDMSLLHDMTTAAAAVAEEPGPDPATRDDSFSSPFDSLDSPDQADADADGLSDTMEAELGTDPLNPDTDGDGWTDGDEVNVYGTDPLNPDSNPDTVVDDSIDSPDSVDSPDSPDSVDSPDSPDSPESPDSVDSPDSDDSVGSS